MKKLLLALLLWPSLAHAYSTVFNPFTSKLDYVGVSTSSISGNFIANQDTLQSGATFYVSSGTVGPFQIKSGADTWQFIPNASSNRVIYLSNGAQFDISDGDSANGGTALVTFLFANGTTNSINAISKPAMILDTGDLALQGAQAGFKIKQKSFGNNYVGFQSSTTVATSTWTLPTKFAPGVWQERALGQIDNTALSLSTGPLVGLLPATSMVSTVAYTTTANVFSALQTFSTIQVSSNSVLANTTFYQDGTVIIGSTTIKAAATDYLLSISSANAIVLFGFRQDGTIVSSGTLPVLSSCGTGPALSVGSSNFSGTITGGSTSTGCTLTFASGGFTNPPTCIISNQSMSVVNAMTYTVSVTALTVTETGLGTSKVDYICAGH